MLRPIILIPTRMAATRLPGKPLADIHGRPMIEHVWRRAVASGVGPVVVAAAELAIAEAITKAGGQAVLTRADHASGSDRIQEAIAALDPQHSFDVVINLQGDVPTIEPACIEAVLAPLAEQATDIATLAVEIAPQNPGADDPNVVKLAGSPLPSGHLKALYFSRARIPWGEGALYHHVGIYAFRRAALDRFVKLPTSALEQREKLEQLRALEAGMRIDAALVQTIPLGVDTPDTLEQARDVLRSK